MTDDCLKVSSWPTQRPHSPVPEGAAKGKQLEPGHQYLTEVVPLGSLNQLFTCRNTCLLHSGAGGLGSC